MKANSAFTLARILIATISFAGCATNDETPGDQAADEPTGESAQQIARVPVAGPASTLVASLKLATGQVIEFHDFGGSALIVESAAAYTPPVLNSAGPTSADELASIWTRLAPGTPVPQALQDLQHRLTNLPASSATPAVLPSPELDGGKIGGPSIGLPAAPQGCNNGCCDASWLSTLAECQGGGWSFSWFLFNYGWSTSTGGSNAQFQGLACSAQGTSTFSVNIGGSGGVWSVPQATYRWFHWVAGTDIFGNPNRQSLSSAVNSSSNQHLHTYCGRTL
jgi:hypothetical protein